MPNSESHPESVSGRLAAFLTSHKDAIRDEWLTRIRRDLATKTEKLTTEALIDHLPQLFDDIIDALRHYRGETVHEQMRRDAAAHATTRLQQGYDLASLLREIAHLRTIFIYHLRMFEESYPDFGMAARLFADATVHRLLDELTVDSAEQFLSGLQA